MQSPPVPRYLVPPRSKYSPQHLILKHPQPPFLPQLRELRHEYLKERDKYEDLALDCGYSNVDLTECNERRWI
jgi:hypothetical protein